MPIINPTNFWGIKNVLFFFLTSSNSFFEFSLSLFTLLNFFSPSIAASKNNLTKPFFSILHKILNDKFSSSGYETINNSEFSLSFEISSFIFSIIYLNFSESIHVDSSLGISKNIFVYLSSKNSSMGI